MVIEAGASSVDNVETNMQKLQIESSGGEVPDNVSTDAHTGTGDAVTSEIGGTEDEGSNPPANFKWISKELKHFWEKAMPKYNCYVLDGLHPKALCSKICNDVLRTNINLNSSSQNPNDRMLCFEVLAQMEQRFIDCEIVKKPERKPGGTAQQLVYRRVTYEDWNRFSHTLKDQSLEKWARDCVEDSIRNLSAQRPSKRGV